MMRIVMTSELIESSLGAKYVVQRLDVPRALNCGLAKEPKSAEKYRSPELGVGTYTVAQKFAAEPPANTVASRV